MTSAIRLGRSVLLCWLGALALAGCASDPTQGYAIGTGSSFSRDVRTVHVPIFQNPTYAKGLEFELTDAVIKEIQRTTPWKVSSASAADTVLEGSITDADLRKLSTQRDSGVVQEQAVGLTVSFAFRDTRSGKTLVGRDRFSASEVFVPANPVKERLEVGENAVIQRMARDIVAELRSSW